MCGWRCRLPMPRASRSARATLSRSPLPGVRSKPRRESPTSATASCSYRFTTGYWDRPEDETHDHSRAANGLTITDWDPVSKQPLFKTAAAHVSRVSAGDGQPAPAPTNTASGPVNAEVSPTRGGDAAEVTEQLSVPAGGTR